MARVLDDALRALDISTSDLARRLGVDERIVRDLRAGARPLTLDRCLEAGPVGAAVLRIVAEHADRTARHGATPERHALACSGAAGELARDAAVGAPREALLGRALLLRRAADAAILDLAEVGP
jgi:hypothetical protein